MIYKEVNYMIDDITWSYSGKSITKDDIIECRETCHKAIEKQIPRKPKVSFQLGFYWCPDCECAIKMKIEKSKKNISYCPFCGQALDWGEEE